MLYSAYGKSDIITFIKQSLICVINRDLPTPT